MPIDSPRNRFRQDKLRAEEWAAICHKLLFIDACDMAMLQLLEHLPNDPESNARLQGAMTYRRLLETLGELPESQPAKTTGQLNHDV